jgi:hypothetical protein
LKTRNRHVKCDEIKPECLRCQKLGFRCDGYAAVLDSKARSGTLANHNDRNLSKKTRLLLPKGVAAAGHEPGVTGPFPPQGYSNPPLRHPQLKQFSTAQEYRCFRLFCDRTTATLSSHFKGSLWNKVVLQACESSPAIRHAVIAIGALDLTMDVVAPAPGFATGSWSMVSSHHRFALQQYSKAITKLGQSLAGQNFDIRNVLIACLLTVCFETWNGDIQSAMTQVRSGLKLIKEWRMNKSTSGNALKTVLDSGTNELMHAFYRLDNDTIVVMDEEPIEIHLMVDPNGKHKFQPIPDEFKTFEEAKMNLELFIGQVLHWIAAAYAWASRSKDESKIRTHPSIAGQADSETTTTPKYEYGDQREAYLDGFRKWYRSFQNLVDSSGALPENFAATTSLKLRWKAIYTSLVANHFQGETSYDALVADFQEIVDLGEALINHESRNINGRRPQYSFDGSFVISIYAVGLKCRDAVTRRRAIRLLENCSIREGTRDSALSAKLMRIQMEIEEAEKIGDFIPEVARIRAIKTTYDIAARTGRMSYLKMEDACSANFVKHYLDFTW